MDSELYSNACALCVGNIKKFNNALYNSSVLNRKRRNRIDKSVSRERKIYRRQTSVRGDSAVSDLPTLKTSLVLYGILKKKKKSTVYQFFRAKNAIVIIIIIIRVQCFLSYYKQDENRTPKSKLI